MFGGTETGVETVGVPLGVAVGPAVVAVAVGAARWVIGGAIVEVARAASVGSVTSGIAVPWSGSARSVVSCSCPAICPVTATAPAASAEAATAAAATTMPRLRRRCLPCPVPGSA